MNILTVDDIAVIRKMICKAAQALDAKPFEAEDGMEALKVLKENQGNFDLIFLDWNMPNMTGLEFLTHIKKHHDYKDIPVIMTTTVNEREKIIKAIQAGAAQYMVKPFTQEDILKKMLERIDAHASLRHLFLFGTKRLINQITELDVEEEHLNSLPEDDGCDLYGQVLVSGQHNVMLLYTTTRDAIGSLIGWTAQKKSDDYDDRTLLTEFRKLLQQVADNSLSQFKDQGYCVPLISSSFIHEKQLVLAEKDLSIVAKKYTADDITINITSFIL